ncbi:hypothetical protein ACHAXA_011177 [Cyclostephanos tholiformis]|uniref:Uncharacterized protein n=1 Tax=Cyclostephanos tholiformis TaxID=382380 RepID=A0ABD3R7M1_9STRA
MPWQAAPSLLIIIGAFNVAAGLIWSVDRAYYGKVRTTDGWCVGWPFLFVDFFSSSSSSSSSSVCGSSSWGQRTSESVNVKKRGRTIGHNQWTWAMEKRDDKVANYRANK